MNYQAIIKPPYMKMAFRNAYLYSHNQDYFSVYIGNIAGLGEAQEKGCGDFPAKPTAGDSLPVG